MLWAVSALGGWQTLTDPGSGEQHSTEIARLEGGQLLRSWLPPSCLCLMLSPSTGADSLPWCGEVARGTGQVSPGSTVPRCMLPQPVLAWGALRGTLLCADPPGELHTVPWDGWLPKASSALALGMVWAGPAAGFVLGVTGLGQPHFRSSRFIETKEVCPALHRMHLADHKSVPECTKAL